MLALLDVAAEMFFAPARGVLQASAVSARKAAGFYFVFLALVFQPAAYILLPKSVDGAFLFLFVFKYLLSLLSIFAFSVLISGLSDFFYGASVRVKQLFSAFVFSLLPFALLPLLLQFQMWQTKADLLVEIFCWWSFGLCFLAVKKLYGFGFFRSLVVLLLPFLFAAVFYSLCFAYVIAFLGTLFFSIV